jgi:hypothetical protein
VALAAAPRIGKDAEMGWYYVPLDRSVAELRPDLDVVVRREADGGPPARVCGGQDDPTRPGNGQSWRLRNGAWSTDNLGDLPIPLVYGHLPPERYYIELRFLDADGLPHVAIWY